MSKNCIDCVKNPRTGADLLCDECREEYRLKKAGGISIGPKDRNAVLAKLVLERVYRDCAAKPDGTTYGLYSDVFEIIRSEFSVRDAAKADRSDEARPSNSAD